MQKRLILSILLFSANSAWADVPDDKSGRIEEYQKRQVQFQKTPAGYTLKIEERSVGDDTLAGFLADPDFTESLNQKFGWRRARQLGLGIPFVPIGAFIFYDNFYGQRVETKWGAPASYIAPFPSQTIGSYLLAFGGGLLAAWGGAMLLEWASETLGFSHANLLSLEDANSAQKRYNAKIRDELALLPGDTSSASATASATPAPAMLPEGTALADEGKAAKALETQRGQGYQLFSVRGQLKDLTQKKPEGGWKYYYKNPQWPDPFEVLVPDFGDPKIGKTTVSGKGDLKAKWTIDSPQAFATIQEELKRRQLAIEKASASVMLDEREVPLWVVDIQGVRIRVNAGSGELLDKAIEKK